MTVAFTLRPFTVSDYARMRESGILTEDDRVELIDGMIHTMSPIGPHHAAVVTRLVKLLTSLAADEAIVSPQNPVQLNDLTEPQPDLSILHPRDDFYAQAHPTPDDIMIVIEVADTTLQFDREEKLPRYAAAGIPEAWIVNLAQQCIEQYTAPANGRYAQMQPVRFGDQLTSATLPQLTFNTTAVLG